MDISILLNELGINIGANAIYDILKSYLVRTTPTKEGLKEALIAELNIENADIKADRIIEFLAENGDIIISGSSIFALKKTEMSSSEKTSLYFGNDSISRTDKTSIEAKGNSKIVARGGAKIIQDDDEIKFST